MSIRRVLPVLLLGFALLSAGCGGDTKGGPGDAQGLGSAEGAAEGSGLGPDASEPGGHDTTAVR